MAPDSKKNAFKDILKGGAETFNEQVDKVKTWASENPNLALGGGAIAGLLTLVTAFGLIPIMRARTANRRVERSKHRNRHDKRALEESLHPGFEEEFTTEEIYDFLSELVNLEELD